MDLRGYIQTMTLLPAKLFPFLILRFFAYIYE